MSYKDILVFLDGSVENAARVDFALSLAKAHGARLTGVDVDSVAAFAGEWSERAKSLEETFHASANRFGVDVRFKVADRNSGEWKNYYTPYADLVIATQPIPGRLRHDPARGARGFVDVGRRADDPPATGLAAETSWRRSRDCLVTERAGRPCRA